MKCTLTPIFRHQCLKLIDRNGLPGFHRTHSFELSRVARRDRKVHPDPCFRRRATNPEDEATGYSMAQGEGTTSIGRIAVRAEFTGD